MNLLFATWQRDERPRNRMIIANKIKKTPNKRDEPQKVKVQ